MAASASNPRSRARRAALQAIYQWQMTAEALEIIAAQFREDKSWRRIDEELFSAHLFGVPTNVASPRCASAAHSRQAGGATRRQSSAPFCAWAPSNSHTSARHSLARRHQRIRGAGAGVRRRAKPQIRQRHSRQAGPAHPRRGTTGRLTAQAPDTDGSRQPTTEKLNLVLVTFIVAVFVFASPFHLLWMAPGDTLVRALFDLVGRHRHDRHRAVLAGPP